MDQLSELSKFKFSPHPPAPAGNDVLLPGTAAVPSFSLSQPSCFHLITISIFLSSKSRHHLGCLHGALYTTRDLVDAQGMSDE